jgi:signal transduction histidine kinase
VRVPRTGRSGRLEVVTKGARRGESSSRAAAWLAWSSCAVCVVLIVLALVLEFVHWDQYFDFAPGERPGPGFAVLAGVLSLAFPAVGALIASRLPKNPIGWIFCATGLLYVAQRFTIAYADYALLDTFGLLPWGEYAAWFSNWIWFAYPTLVAFLMLLFPAGRLPSLRWRIVAWMTVLGAALTAMGDAFMPGFLLTHPFADNPFGIAHAIWGTLTTYGIFGFSRVFGMALLLLCILAALVSLVLRLHYARGNERQQLKWFLFAAVPLTILVGLIQVDGIVHDYTTDFGLNPSYLLYEWNLLLPVNYLAVLILLAVPICTYIAILRFNLYDIDIVINRTLVFGALTACIVGIYVLAVVALGYLFQAQGNLAVSLTATGLVAVLFQPLRGRLQRGVNRLMYGERDDPYAVISRLGKRLEAALEPEAVLPTVVETIAQALKLPYAAIQLEEDGQFRTSASYGSPTAEPEVLPLVYQREDIGRLVLSPRVRGEGFSDADRSLLEDLARQAEVAVHAVRLTADLQRSRQRLVATREEERRRLRRDLHDGLGAQLAGLNVQAGTIRRLIPTDPGAADELVVELRKELRGAITDIRRLVYDLRPPALDDLGLGESLRQLAERHGGSDDGTLRVAVEAPEDLPDLPAAVEVAVYRITQEALTNVARHARAKTCVVRLTVDGDLLLEIADDGVGIPAGRSAGVGLSSMRERAAELGGTCTVEALPEGGTRVLLRLPLAKE